jgi:hypothetical protein
MERLKRFVISTLLAGAGIFANADETGPASLREQVDAHVRAQFRVFGPLSEQREFFGYVYWRDGVLASAVIRGRRCSSLRACGLDTAEAARLIPARARILAEWHTHPHDGSGQLSTEDVSGAYLNRRIPGYTPYYSMPNGDIYAWDPRQDCVRDAMASKMLIGNYRGRPSPGGAETPGPTRHVRGARRVFRSASARVHRAAASSRRWARD